MKVVDNYECANCGRSNKELVVFETKGWFFTREVKICQKCISKAFASFRKDR